MIVDTLNKFMYNNNEYLTNRNIKNEKNKNYKNNI